ncbi:MAG: DNA polymerase III subunit delta [Clostridia bacterium]|nr:DNA polymerase III subunit delta [Clostridia bacterium]
MAEKRYQSKLIMDTDALDKEMKSGLSGAYLFYGEEDYLKQNALTKIRAQILTAEGFELFNHSNISFTQDSEVSKDSLYQKLLDAMESVPMMQDQVLVEVHDLSIDKLKQDELDSLVAACKKASNDTILIIFCRDIELPCVYRYEDQKSFKALSEVCKCVRFGLLTKGRLEGYVKKYLAREKVLITEDASELLCEMCSLRLYPLLGEMTKLIAYMSTIDGERKEVTASIVRQICSETADDESPFALSEAMQKWQIVGMLETISMAKDQKEEPVMYVGKLAKTYTEMLMIKAAMSQGLSSLDISKTLRINQFRVEKYMQNLSRVPIGVIENAVDEVFELDLKLKSTMSDPWTMIECFISKIYMPKSLKGQ